MLPPALISIFEEQLQFQLEDGDVVEGAVCIGESEFSPVEVLRTDRASYVEEFNRWLETRWRPDMEETRDQVITDRVSKQRYEALQRRVSDGGVYPFVGSGMSVPTGLPTWTELLESVCTQIGAARVRLDALLRQGKFEEAADWLSKNANERLLFERIEEELSIHRAQTIQGPVRLVPVIFPSLALTTNLDWVLETCYEQNGSDPLTILAGTEVARYRELKTNGSNFVLKLHGDCRTPGTRVLLSREYRRAYARGSDSKMELELLARNNSILFLGCSLRTDRTMELFRAVAGKDRRMPRHFTLEKRPHRGQQTAREDFLTNRGVFPIWYDGEPTESVTALLAGLIPSGPFGD